MLIGVSQAFLNYMLNVDNYCIEKNFDCIDTSLILEKFLSIPDNIFYNYLINNVKSAKYHDARSKLRIGGFKNPDQLDFIREIHIDLFSNDNLEETNTNKYLVDPIVEKLLVDTIPKILKEIGSYSKEYQLYHLGLALVKLMPYELEEFLTDCELDINAFKKFFNPKDFRVRDILPEALDGFLTNNNVNIIKGESCKTLGRDEQVKALWNILLKKTKRNAILVGPPGVGKTAIIDRLTYQIVNEKCPKEFYNFKILFLDVTSIVAGTRYRGDAESKFAKLIEYLEKEQNVILFIDEVHLIMGAGTSATSSIDLANSLKPLLAKGTTRVIGATTNEEYQKYFSQDGAIKRRFEVVEVPEPKSTEVYKMIKNKLVDLENYHGVKISKKMVDYVALNASCFNYESKNPDRTLDLIDRAMVSSKLANCSFVTKKHVLENFQNNFSIFNQLNEHDKTMVAYHEAGHFILWKELDNGKYTNLLAVSIIPCDNYLGINVLEPLKFVFPNLEYFETRLALLLGGRVAENMISQSKSAGAANDLAEATKIAKDMVYKYHLTDDALEVLDFVEGKNANSAITVNSDINNLLENASVTAKKILEENKSLLLSLVKELVSEGILSKAQLDAICEKNNKKKK